ncbi:hypothetical protein BH24ACT15_BH24ACT15_39110 [soil metagenome]
MTATTRRHWSRWLPPIVVAVTAALPLPNLLQSPVRLLIIGVAVAVAIVDTAGSAGQLKTLRQGWLLWPSTVFGVFGLMAVVTSPRPLLSWFGEILTTRGFLLYLVLLLLALATALRQGQVARPLLYATTVAAGLVSLVVFAQWAGLGFETIGLETLAGLPGTLGNPNFAAGWLGAALIAPVWVAVETRHASWVRVVATLTAVAVLTAIALTRAFQGPVVVTVVVAVALLGWSVDWDRRRRVVLVSAVAVAVVIGVASMIGGLGGQGPLAGVMTERGIELRQDYWNAALDMGSDSLITGVGFDRYGREYRQYRNPDTAGDVSVESFADAAHSVPLQFFATGGIPLVLAYLSLVVLVAAAGLLAVRRTAVPYDRRIAAAVMAMWAGYQAQSMISIDDPALAMLGWVSGGALVGLWLASGASTQAVTRSSTKTSRNKRRSGRTRPSRPSNRVRVIAWVVAGLIALVAGVPSFVEILSGARAGGRPLDVLARIDRSAGLAPWEPRYPKQDGVLSLDEGLGERAAAAFVEADRRAGGDFAAMLSLARTREAIGDPEGAIEAFEEALRLEPSHPQVAAEVARYLLNKGRRDRASEIVAAAITSYPDNPQLRNLEQAAAAAK